MTKQKVNKIIIIWYGALLGYDNVFFLGGEWMGDNQIGGKININYESK